jgi:hypothetical protein
MTSSEVRVEAPEVKLVGELLGWREDGPPRWVSHNIETPT